MNKPKYQIVDGKETKAVAVKIQSAPFSGMVVRFGKVGVRENGNSAQLAFDFDVIKGKLPKNKEKFSRLENTLGDILVDILENNMDEVEFLGGDD
tara:strand:+ start:295 stop:579 length:285 start_codon:yes stop_codon:yes gene_type:complete